jgi:serine phosphatase RsbU (regulator of sigma subunit)/putative methionine-R-sulfoxide reductase with GAF domain
MRSRTSADPVRELELLNEVSRAIIRSALDVDALCELVYREASKVLDTAWFHLALFDGTRYMLKVRIVDGVRQPPLTVDLADNEGLMGWVRRTGRALLVEDFAAERNSLPAQPRYQAEHPPRSGIYVPLLAGDAVLGTISVQSTRPRAFNKNHLRLLSLLADSAAAAIATARAYDALRQRIAQLELIGKVGRQAAMMLDLDKLLPSVVRLIRDEFQYFQVHLFAYDPRADQLLFRASTVDMQKDGVAWRERNARIGVGSGIIGYVAQTRAPYVANDVGQEPRFILDVDGTQSEAALPLLVGDDLIGVLDVQSDRRNAFDEDTVSVLQTLADQIAVAIQSANAYTRQQQEAQTLSALLLSAETIARATGLDELVTSIVRLPPLLVGCDHAAILLRRAARDEWDVLASSGWERERHDLLRGAVFTPEQVPLLEQVRRDKQPLTLDAQEGRAVLQSIGLETPPLGVLLLPMTVRGAVLGVLVLVGAPAAEGWNEHQLTLASGIAGQAASALENALLAQQAVEQERLAQEVRVARDIQTTLLPHAPPQVRGWDVAAAYRSARAVGGDFYDFWTLQEHIPPEPLGFVIADVSDKGVPAAMFMALSRSLMRAAALDGSPPATAVRRANNWIARDSQSGMFVTLFYGLVDPPTGDLRYTNGGHNPPLLLRADGTLEKLDPTGMVLGIIEDARYREAQLTFNVGDVLVCYTDGVTEAVDGAMNEYGVQRLVDTVRRVHELDAERIVDTILTDLATHTGEQAAFDDVTLVILKRVGTSAT